MPVLLGEAPFAHFLQLSDWLYATTRQTHQIALERLYDLLHEAMQGLFGLSVEAAREVLAKDYAASGARGAPKFLESTASSKKAKTNEAKTKSHATRQARHLA